jgi:signal transduction histidine kinase
VKVGDSQVVLIADDPGFAHDLMARWQQERGLPGITVMSTDQLTGSGKSNFDPAGVDLTIFDLAIVGSVRHKRLVSVLKVVENLNNCLTSVMGNAELLLLDADAFAFTEPVRDQLQTIHEMALRMHEIMQRFSSVAAELRTAENSSQDETGNLSHAASTIQ